MMIQKGKTINRSQEDCGFIVVAPTPQVPGFVFVTVNRPLTQDEFEEAHRKMAAAHYAIMHPEDD